MLLILIYRSPIFLWIPLFAVVFAEVTTRSIGYALTEIGVTVNGQTSSILSILVLGAGTDYALLLVSRYREELRKHEDKHEAMALALRTAGPAIVASGATVMARCSASRSPRSTAPRASGPIGALGIAWRWSRCSRCCPRCWSICGRRAFWRPAIFGWGNGDPALRRRGRGRDARRLAARRRARGAQPAADLDRHRRGARGRRARPATIDTGLTQADAYRDQVESLEGQELLAKSFPAGASAATEVIVAPGGDVQAVAGALRGRRRRRLGAADRPLGRRRARCVNVMLEPEPYSTEAFKLIPELRAAAKEAGGEDTLVGGPSAIEYDVRKAAARDTKRDHPDRARRRLR